MYFPSCHTSQTVEYKNDLMHRTSIEVLVHISMNKERRPCFRIYHERHLHFNN